MVGMASPAGPEATREAEYRAAIVAAGRRLRAAGLVAATEGNLSARLGRERLLITPSGRRKDELAADDLVVAAIAASDASGTAPAGMPSSDIAIHRAVYAARPDLGAVVHAHLPASMGLTLAGEIPEVAPVPFCGPDVEILVVIPGVATLFPARAKIELRFLFCLRLRIGVRRGKNHPIGSGLEKRAGCFAFAG